MKIKLGVAILIGAISLPAISNAQSQYQSCINACTTSYNNAMNLCKWASSPFVCTEKTQTAYSECRWSCE